MRILPAPRRRRSWLRRGLLLVVVLAVGAVVAAVVAFSRTTYDTTDAIAFEQRLAIPPLAKSKLDTSGRRVFDLTAQEGESELLPGRKTRTWGFNGAYLGPTLRAAVGEDVRVRVRSQLGEDTSVHWHGMHLPASMDGGPHQPVVAGGTWSPQWRIDQNAATLWYHPHPHGRTEEHVYRGLAGLFIVDDPDDPAQRALPHEYGVDDIPVIVQDKSFEDGALASERFGDTILVNGTYAPYLDVSTELVRLRVLNASTARVYDFGFADDRSFQLVGTDGGLLPRAWPMTRLRLSPGERGEIVLAVKPGERTVLRSYPPDLGLNAFQAAFVGGRDSFDVLQVRAGDKLAPSAALPGELAEPPKLGRPGDEVDRRFILQGRKINGKAMDMSRIDETVTLGATETWEVENTDGTYHNFHVHDVQFQVVTVDGRPPANELLGWKDTVMVPPGRVVRLAMRFTDYADPKYPYMFHCHLLQHEDRGMMGQFVVVQPGQRAAAPPGTGHHGGH